MYKRSKNKETNSFIIKEALKTVLNQLRICRHKITGISPFESHLSRHANTPLSNISTTLKYFDLSYDRILNCFLYEKTVTPNELLPKQHWGTYCSDKEVERNVCKHTRDAQTRERNATDNVTSFLRSSQIHCAFPLKESAVQIKIARKRHPNKRSKKNLDGLYKVLALGSVVQKTYQKTSVIREPGNRRHGCNSDIMKFGTKTKLQIYKNRGGPRLLEKSTRAKILSHTKH